MTSNKRLKYKNAYYVYLHIDPRTSQVVYVGQGTSERAWTYNGRSPKHKKWFRQLNSLGFSPIIKLIHVFNNKKDALIREIMLISFFSKKGKLFNRNKGGGGPLYHSVLSKSKMSESQKGTCKPWLVKPARKRMMGNTLRRGQKQPPEAIEKLRKTLIGNQRRSIKILCVNNNTIYRSIKEAWTALDLDERSVFRVLKGEYGHTRGYVFRYVK